MIKPKTTPSAFRSLSEIRPYEQNPRRNDDAVDACAKSIERFGFQQPIVVDRDGVIIVGHTRFKAAQQLGLERVPVIVADLSPELAAEYRIADNKTHELSSWDDGKLEIELSAIVESGSDFDPFAFGFSEEEIEALLGGEIVEGLTDPDETPEIPETSSIRPGTLFQLGDSRLICGDSTDLQTLRRLLGDERADLFLTDPPYNVDYEGGTGLKIQNDSMGDAQFQEFLTASFRAADSVMDLGAAFYIWHADSEGLNFRTAAKNVGWKVRECLIWVKNALVLGRQDYQWRHEPCLYGWKDGAAHGWYGDRKQTTVLEFPKPQKSELHPTMKPVELFERLVLNSTKRGDSILDSFAGSGTSFIVAERTGRRLFGVELDPRYCEAIIERWEAFTGQKAKEIE